MDGSDSDNESGKFSWSSDDDEPEEKKPTIDHGTSFTAANTEEGSSSSGPSSILFRNFVEAGFSEDLVSKAIEENGDGNMESILNALLTYAHLQNSASNEQIIENHPETQQNGDFAPRVDDGRSQNLDADSDQKFDVDSDDGSSDYYENIEEDLSDLDSCPGLEDSSPPRSKEQQKFKYLKGMGYPADEISIAMERCGLESSIEELTDFIIAAQLAREYDASYVDPPSKLKLNGDYGRRKKRKMSEYELAKKKQMGDFEDDPIRLPKPMIGFGVPTQHCPPFHRTLPEGALGPPYFYYENVALTPKGVWDTISRFLYDVEPEFVDSKFFCAAARKRGYIHNLPIENRYPLLPMPPRTINEALPVTKRWWPTWDTRTKLNCLQTTIGSAKLTERIRKAVERYDGDPPRDVQKFVIEQCRKWNLVWIGRNKVAPLEADEVEMLLGFPRNHTRGGGVSRTDRYKSLGNSFQVDTVAYHLSVLKELFPDGMNVLSLFSGIGGAEVALHRLGIRLKTVVSVEKSEVNRDIVRVWWEQTNQTGILIDIDDVQKLTGDRIEHLISVYGGFDLVIGGSPCNNLAGSNRVSRDGLEGKESSLFFDYHRILELVKGIMARNV